MRQSLLQKACLAYITLAEMSRLSSNYSSSLQYLQLAVSCSDAIKEHPETMEWRGLRCCLRGLMGDVYFLLLQHWNVSTKMKEEFGDFSNMDKKITDSIKEYMEKGEKHKPGTIKPMPYVYTFH